MTKTEKLSHKIIVMNFEGRKGINICLRQDDLGQCSGPGVYEENAYSLMREEKKIKKYIYI